LELRCMNWCYDRVCIDSALPLHKVPLRFYDDTPSDGEYGEALIEGGLFQVLQHLFDEIKDKIDLKFNHEVQKIVCNNSLITVSCSNGKQYTAQNIIVTLPVGVLKSNKIEFIPRPPQLESLCQKQFGTMNLVWLWYPSQFWPSGYNYFGVSRDETSPPKFSTFLVPPMTNQDGQKEHIVMCQTFGDFALTVETMTELEVATAATSVLREIFGSTVPDPIGCVRSAWFSDPFSRGSYSCSPEVASNRMRNDIFLTESGAPFIYFAGEATYRNHQGTAHGAYISGVREAQKVLKSFGINMTSDDMKNASFVDLSLTSKL